MTTGRKRRPKGTVNSTEASNTVSPNCPACNERMKGDGRAFRCEPCRQILLFFAVHEMTTFVPAGMGDTGLF
jgi:tRNA(Ile2) C34 agmatinyltransferase TiaS